MVRLTHAVIAALSIAALAGPARAADVVIGAAGPTSNAEALFGTTWMNGMELAIRNANAAGGVNGQKITLRREDDGGDPKQGTLIAQKYCDSPDVVAVIADFNSGVTIPASDVYNRCNMPQVTNSSNPRVTQPGYKNLVRPIANDLMQGAAPARYALETLKAKTAAVVHDKQAFGQGVAEVFRQSFTKGGGKVANFSGVTATDVDFSALITSLRGEKPDVVVLRRHPAGRRPVPEADARAGHDRTILCRRPRLPEGFHQERRAAGRRRAPSCRSRRLPTTPPTP